jgi:hypothetical protein
VAPVRAARYLAALVGVRRHPILQEVSERRLARGTPQQVALVAWRHQRLIIVPAVVRDRTPWAPHHAAVLP